MLVLIVVLDVINIDAGSDCGMMVINSGFCGGGVVGE